MQFWDPVCQLRKNIGKSRSTYHSWHCQNCAKKWSKYWRNMMEASRLAKCQQFRNGPHEVFPDSKFTYSFHSSNQSGAYAEDRPCCSRNAVGPRVAYNYDGRRKWWKFEHKFCSYLLISYCISNTLLIRFLNKINTVDLQFCHFCTYINCYNFVCQKQSIYLLILFMNFLNLKKSFFVNYWTNYIFLAN
jgi:hypothetical protein